MTKPVTRRGYDGAGTTPVGATVTRVYWVTPGHYGPSATGVEHDTEEAAIREAIARWEAERDAAQAYDRTNFLPTTLWVDCRWTMTYPPGSGPTSGIDAVTSRTTYDDVHEAREHLARIEKYRSPV